MSCRKPHASKLRTAVGMSLLEVMLVLSILALASSLMIFRYSPNTSNQQWLKLEQLLHSSRDQSFYQQDTIRLSCDSKGIQQQRLKDSGPSAVPGHGASSWQWQNTGKQLKLNSTVCLFGSAYNRCTPCPISDSSNRFEIVFRDGLANESLLLLDASNRDTQSSIQAKEGLRIYAHGHIELLESGE